MVGHVGLSGTERELSCDVPAAAARPPRDGPRCGRPSPAGAAVRRDDRGGPSPGLQGDDGGARDRAGGRLQAGVLRAVRQQGRLLPRHLRHCGGARQAADARRVDERARLGQPRAQGVSGVRGRREAERQVLAPGADRGPGPGVQESRTADALGDRVRAGAGGWVQGGARRGAAPAVGTESDRGRRPLPAVRPAANGPRGGAADADRRTARLDQLLPLAGGTDRGGAHPAAAQAGGAGALPGKRGQARARARRGARTSRWTRATTS